MSLLIAQRERHLIQACCKSTISCHHFYKPTWSCSNQATIISGSSFTQLLLLSLLVAIVKIS